MKSFKKNTRGQFTIIAALLISILTLSLVLSIHQTNLHRQQLRYEPVEELVLGITSDLDRCLTHALSIATQQYHATGSEGDATSAGYEFISKWVRSILASYSHLGLKMNVNKTEVGLTDVSWRLDWGREVGLSQVYTKFDLDIEAYGFKGWVGRSGKFVTLKIFPESITLNDQSTTLNFSIFQGKDQPTPIPNLTPEYVEIWAYMTKTTKIPANITNLGYLGNGIYTVTFTPRIYEHTLGVEMTAITPEDKIFVFTYFNKEADFIINLQSQEENSTVPTNLGSIQLAAINYTLYPNGTSTTIDPGTYMLRYYPEEGYTFLNWTTIGDIIVTEPNSSISPVRVDGNGTITAFYKRIIPPEPVIVTLTLDSRDWQNLTQHLGNITLGLTTYTLPAENINVTTGEYPLQYEPPDSSYEFLKWDPVGAIIPANSSANPTTLTVLGNGTIIAVYRHKPTPPTLVTVNLESREDSNATQNLGKIQLAETNYTLYPNGNTTTVSSGPYWLEYFPENESYTFLNWTTIGDITVADDSSRWTTVTINGNGTIIAFYALYTPPEPEILELRMDSREEGNETLTHLGSIIFNSTSYILPNATSLTAGNYTLEYEPDNSSSYFFIEWKWEGGVIPLEPNKNSTILTVFGNGTIIAVYSTAPPITTLCNVTLQSQEENSPIPTNNGSIQLGATLFSLPNSTSIANGTYFLTYTPAEGYTFLYWITTGDIIVQDNSTSTWITINGDGTITAFYRGYNVYLDSRHWQNLSFSYGNITLGADTYTLPNYVKGLAAGDYTIQYIPPNSSYIFLCWEFTGGIFPTNTTSSSTTLKIFGDGNLTAVYYVEPPTSALATVALRSLEETLAPPGNLGKIRLGETVFALPNSTTVAIGTYLLEYIPQEGYTFVGWTTTGNVIVGNTSSSITGVTINGNGTITAIYRGCKVTLNSRHWDNLPPPNMGTITLGAYNYTLPKNLTGLAPGDYFLQYTPYNSSYVFLWWEPSGNVIPWNWTSNTTMLTVYGDGTLTAVYGLISEPPPPFVGDWSTIYVDRQKDPILVPPFMLSGKSSHIPSWASTGVDKQIVVVNSPPAPTIYLARYVNITAYVGIDPPSNAKEITIEFGFNYSGQYYKLGNSTFPVSSDGVYRMTIDTLYSEFPGKPGVIPEGSVFTLTITVTFFKAPWGTFKLFYWVPKGPSSIELF